MSHDRMLYFRQTSISVIAVSFYLRQSSYSLLYRQTNAFSIVTAWHRYYLLPKLPYFPPLNNWSNNMKSWDMEFKTKKDNEKPKRTFTDYFTLYHENCLRELLLSSTIFFSLSLSLFPLFASVACFPLANIVKMDYSGI